MDVSKGSVFVIYGSSGIGKSTLINTLLGLQQNYEGAVLIDGYDLKKLSKITNTLPLLTSIFKESSTYLSP